MKTISRKEFLRAGLALPLALQSLNLRAATRPAPVAAPTASDGGSMQVAEAASGEDVYKQACSACHTAGVAGAPKLGDAAGWSGRISQGMETLVEHAIKGYQGSAGYMPPKGGRADLSDDAIKAAVEYMTENSK